MVVTKTNHIFVIAIIFTRLILWHGVGIAVAKPYYNYVITGYGSLQSNYWNNGPRTREARTYGESSEESQSLETLPNRREINSQRTNAKSVARCGVEDDTGPLSYQVLKTEWKSRYLTYKITKYSRSPHTLGGRGNIDAEIRKAFDVWEEVTPFTFERGTGKVDIDIRFEIGTHADGDNIGKFDGPGRILAHAFRPTIGRIHFDDDEYWTSGTYEGKNLFQVAAHEIGHTIGLDHSDVEDSLMYPNYGGYMPNFSLHPDDIAGIQSIYGVVQSSGETEESYYTIADDLEEQLPSDQYDDEREFREPSQEVSDDEYSDEQVEGGLESRHSTAEESEYDYAQEHWEAMYSRPVTPSYTRQNWYFPRYFR